MLVNDSLRDKANLWDATGEGIRLLQREAQALGVSVTLQCGPRKGLVGEDTRERWSHVSLGLAHPPAHSAGRSGNLLPSPSAEL